jgi:nicotinate-nucleotide adenylyltransferase
VYPRPNDDGGDLQTHARVKWINAPLMELSSTFIRQSIKNGKDVRYMMPESVADYIDEMNFYRK